MTSNETLIDEMNTEEQMIAETTARRLERYYKAQKALQECIAAERVLEFELDKCRQASKRARDEQNDALLQYLTLSLGFSVQDISDAIYPKF